MAGKRTRLQCLLDRVSPEPNTGCWLWLGGYAGDYGQFHMNGHHTPAPRAAWMLMKGPIPDGVEVCHRCDTWGCGPACVNPDHLFLGTHAENMRDFASKGRGTNQHAQKTHCPAGHPYDEINTAWTRAGTRHCRECSRRRRREWGARRAVLLRASREQIKTDCRGGLSACNQVTCPTCRPGRKGPARSSRERGTR